MTTSERPGNGIPARDHDADEVGLSRRAFARASASAVVGTRWLSPRGVSAAPGAIRQTAPRQQFGLDDGVLIEATVASLQALLASGALSARELIAAYTARITRFNDQLHAVIALNPEAEDLAVRLDRERERGSVRGPLHGIPILLKDNIGTGDAMATTAGAAALADAHCDRDAYLVRRLRAAGAVILGKANMSEWANWMSRGAPSGYSATGGQTVNPYGAWLDPLGSSSGPAVAVAANLVTLAVGTETRGSIIAPAAANSVVGIHPSLGLVSRDRVIPLCATMDTPGPIARTVADAAILLTALAAHRDRADPAGAAAKSLIGLNFVAGLDGRGLRGKRIGFIPSNAVSDADAAPALQALSDAGATVAFVESPGFDAPEREAFVNAAFRAGVNGYLAATTNPTVRTLSEVIAFNDTDPARYAPYGQDRLLESDASPLTGDEAEAGIATYRDQARAVIRSLMTAVDADLLVSLNNTFATEYALAGFPAVAVPAGYASESGAPFGFTFVGDFLTDRTVIACAHAFEQTLQARRPPSLS